MHGKFYLRYVVSDRGAYFTSEKWNKMCTIKGIPHILTSPTHPRANRTLVPAINAEIGTEHEWDKC